MVLIKASVISYLNKAYNSTLSILGMLRNIGSDRIIKYDLVINDQIVVQRHKIATTATNTT